MKITKIGHCCLLIEEKGIRILTDPGAFSGGQNSLTNIDIVLITHNHQDHLHMDSVKQILKNNPDVIIVTNSTVGAVLEKEGIKFTKLEHGGNLELKGIIFEGHGEKHAVIYQEFGQTQNTGFMISGRLFYPGDAFYNPGKPVEVLALPVSAPWMRLADAVDYAKEVRPKKAFPVHDAIASEFFIGFAYGMYSMLLKMSDIEFIDTNQNNQFEIT